MKLFVVRIQTEVVVRAANPREAREALSPTDIADIVDMGDESNSSVFEMTRLPPGWDKDCIPFGNSDDEDGNDLTVGEWMEKASV